MIGSEGPPSRPKNGVSPPESKRSRAYDIAAGCPALDHLAAFEVGRDLHLDKSGFAQPGFDPLGRSGTGDAAAQQGGIGSQFGRQWCDVDDIGDREPAAGFEDAKGLPEYLLLDRHKIDHAI